jgi:phospholipase/carboxylesterase
MSTPLPPHGGQPRLTAGAPLATARAAMILIHGRGAWAEGIIGLADAFGRDDVHYVAPNALGGTWYPTSFMSPLALNEPGISSGISVVHGLIDELVAAGLPEQKIVLCGFSQGACLASTSAQRRARRYGAVLAFSGGLIGPPGMSWDESGDFAGTPAFFGCSDVDPHIPESRVRETAALYERMGATVTTRIYRGMAHTVNEDEVQFGRDVLATIAAD